MGTNTDGVGEGPLDIVRAKQAAPYTNVPEQEDVDAGKDGVDGAYPDTGRAKPEPPNTKKAGQTDFDTANDGQVGTTADKDEVNKAVTAVGRFRAEQRSRDTNRGDETSAQNDLAKKGCSKSGRAPQGSGMQLRHRSRIEALQCSTDNDYYYYLRFAQLLIVLKLDSSLAPGNNKLPREAKKHPMIAFSLLSSSPAPF